VFGFAIEFRKKIWVNTHAERETRMQNLRLNACFRKKSSKLITFLLKMRKGFEAEQPHLLIFCSTNFILFKSVYLLANFFVLGYR